METIRLWLLALAAGGGNATFRTIRDVVIIIALSLLVAAFAGQYATPAAWLPFGLALAAFGVALMCAYRLRLLDFAPEVLCGDVILPRQSRIGGEVKFLLPLHFTNSGSAGGVVQWVALRVTVDNDPAHSVLFSPVAEVDMQRFLQSKRRLDEQNSADPFIGFPLEGKRAISKFVLFDLAERGRTKPLNLRAGRYSFELFVKTSATKGPKLERTFEHTITPKHLEEFAADAPVYLIDYQINLPAARREMGGPEWMPRGAPRYSN